MYPLRSVRALTAIAVLGLSAAACSHHSYDSKEIQTKTFMSETEATTMAAPNAQMKAVLDAQASLGGKPIETLTAKQARLQPTPADGAKKVMRNKGMNPNDPMGVKTSNITIPGPNGPIPARLYYPADAKSKEILPVIVYYHGGGWVIADNNVYDATPRGMAKQVNAIVVAVDYHRAPEHKFPSQHNEAFAAYKWTINNIGKYAGDPRRVAVMGESAGGNLAINTAIMARDAGIQAPVHEVLVYPVAGVDMNTPSYRENAYAKPLNKAMMGWFVRNTIRTEKDKMDPRLDIIGRADLQGLPTTTIVTAQIDPLRSDGERLADRLQGAGVPVTLEAYDGVTHEFFGMAAVVSEAKDAQGVVASDLKKAFNR